MLKAILISLQKRLFRFIRKDFLSIIASLIIAIATWFIVSITIFPTTITTITNIKLQEIILDDTPAGNAGLSVVSPQLPETVSVQITGKRVEIGSLQADRMVARVVIPDDITTPGEYDLKIVVTSIDGINFTMNEVYPSSCKVEFDKNDTVEVPVIVEPVNINVAEGFTYDKDNVKADPEFVTIEGPKSRVDSITSVVVKLDGNGEELNATRVYTSTEFVVKSGPNEMDIESNKLSVKPDAFLVEIPIMREKNLKVTVNYLNAPSNFNPKVLEEIQTLSLEDNEITFASPDDSIDRYSEFPLDIDIRVISAEKYTFEFDVNEIAEKQGMGDFTNISGTSKITVTFDMENFTNQTFVNLNNFEIRNVPQDYDVKMVSNSVTLTFIGPKDQLTGINALTVSDISLVIDLSNATVSNGKFTAEVIVSTPEFDGIWVSSKPVVTMRGEQKP